MQYDTSGRHSAPRPDVIVRASRRRSRSVRVRARLDTGADVTLVPEHIIADLRPPVDDVFAVAGYDNIIAYQ